MYDFATNLIHDRRREASLARYSNFCIRRGVIAARVVFRGGEEGRRRIVKNCFPLVFLQLSPTRLHPSLPISDAIISLVLSRSPSYVARDVSCHPFRRNVTYVGAFSSSCATLVSRSTLWRCFPTHFSYEIIADFHSLSNRRISIFMYRCATRYLRFCFI